MLTAGVRQGDHSVALDVTVTRSDRQTDRFGTKAGDICRSTSPLMLHASSVMCLAVMAWFTCLSRLNNVLIIY